MSTHRLNRAKATAENDGDYGERFLLFFFTLQRRSTDECRLDGKENAIVSSTRQWPSNRGIIFSI